MFVFEKSYSTAQQNLAFEEWYFNHFNRPSLRLWHSPRSVVIGKHQNAFAECRLTAAANGGVPVLRRISGGGTVYHSEGNLNFSFFQFSTDAPSYEQNLSMIVKSLAEMGFNTTPNERHDLLLDGLKISGNAQHRSRGRQLHHGTLLYDVDSMAVGEFLKPENVAVAGYAVKSRRAKVGCLRQARDAGPWKDFYEQWRKGLSAESGLSETDEAAVNALANSKYSDDAWNLTYGPGFTQTIQTRLGPLTFHIERGAMLVKIEGLTAEELPEPYAAKGVEKWMKTIGLSAIEIESALKELF